MSMEGAPGETARAPESAKTSPGRRDHHAETRLPAVDVEDVDFLGVQYQTSMENKSQRECVPEIEIKLESSEEDEDKPEQSSSCVYHHPRKKSGPGPPSKDLSGDPRRDQGMDERPLRGSHVTHSLSPLTVRPVRKRKPTSEVWQFFYRDPTNICRAICSLCRMSVSRGKLGGNFGTTALKRHLQSKHPLEWAQRQSMRLQRADAEEEEEETCEDEEEKDETVAHRRGPKALQAQDNTPASPPGHCLPKTYEIIDSSDEDEEPEKGGRILAELGESVEQKRRRVEDDSRRTASDSSFILDVKNPSLSLSIPNYYSVPLGARRRKSTSAVWQFFCIDHTNICRAICTLCLTSVSRGKQGGHFGTSALMRHLEGKHPMEWGRGRPSKPKDSSAVDAEDDEEEDADEHMVYPQSRVAYGQFEPPDFNVYPEMSAGMSAMLNSAPAAYDSESNEVLRHSNVSTEIPPPPYKENHLDALNLNPNSKYPPNHPRAQSWNSCITELMCEMALPYSFIASKPFRKFMARADSRYCVPSKSFFSLKAVPQLYEATCEKIVSALKRSESHCVHLATHVWAGDLAMDYLALTAHWVVVNSDDERPVERKHAVLCIKRFAKEFSEPGVQQEIMRQVNVWLSPNGLNSGFLISSGDHQQITRGDVYAHVPCFTHSLNLLVKDFLQTNRYVAGVITAARKVCSHFVYSTRARRVLSEFQYQNNWPRRSLKVDNTPHWTSTFHMLQRLLEQQTPVHEYLSTHKADTADLFLTPTQWSLLASLVDLLQPFEMATQEVNADHSCLSQVLPELRYLHIFLKQIRGHFESKGDANGVVLADSFALKLSTDYGVSEMFQKEELVLSTLLDPRFKGRIEAILPPESDIDHWKQVLVRKVKEVMSSSSSVSQINRPSAPFRDSAEATLLSGKNFSAEAGGMSAAPHWRRNAAGPPLIHKEKSLIEHLESVGLLASRSTGASLSTESHSACVMVEKYLQDNKTIAAKDDPLSYWNKRTWLWPALSKLAVTYLTCPPSSVFAERVFRAPQMFMDKQRPWDDMEGMEHIMFLKFNLKNFPNDSPAPLTFSSDNESEQSASEDGSY